MFQAWINAQAERMRRERVEKALAKVERHIKAAQYELLLLGFTKHDKTPQIALRQTLRAALIHTVRYGNVAGVIADEEIDQHLKEPTNYAA